MLAGLRVLELGQNVAGPHASQILADLGAEVIKIERPGGEEGRRLGPPFVGDDAAWYHHINRGKKSVTIDLKDISQRDSLIALIGGADVFIHNSRPGVMARFGLDAATMRARFPRLIYADISAFGSRGPLADRPGYELLMQAYGGLMSITGGPDAPPTRMAPSMVDLGTGMWVAIGILAALVRRGVTGTGAHVEASLLETALDFSAIHIVNYLASRAMPQRSTDGFPGLVPYGGMRCSDGSLIVGAGNDRLFAKLATTLGRHEWAIDPRFANNAARVEHRAELHAELDPLFLSRTVAEWGGLLDAAGIPNAPIRTVPELIGDPQVEALGIIPSGDGLQPPAALRLPLSFNGVRPPGSFAVAAPGEHNRDYLNDPDSDRP